MIHPVLHHMRNLACLAILCVLAACNPASEEMNQTGSSQDRGKLLQVGTITVTQADLDYQLQEKHAGRSDEATRRQALDELTERARYSQAALDAGLDDDAMARAEIARILSTRLREQQLFPQAEGCRGADSRSPASRNL